mmetsp:Transcript_43835/g.81949  ORF Transcript_43835/g.81949 Transcript_43835/m.81949 type:complete len:214 (-) Transcript_43835:1887-2528(-)
MHHVDGVEQGGHHAVVGGHVARHLGGVGGHAGGPLRLDLVSTDLLDHLARVDLHWALLLAHAVRRARRLAVIVEQVLEVVQPLLILLRAVIDVVQPLDLAPHRDTLARGEGEVLGGAVALAKAALNAAVHQAGGLRAGLEVLAVHVHVAVQNDARVEHVVGVKQLLELPHEVSRLLAPLHLHERRHVTTSAVLRLERAAVLVRHQRAQLLHHH